MLAKKAQLFGSVQKSPTFWDANLARKSRAFGNNAKKSQKKPSFHKKSPTFWDADLARKSRAFGNNAKKEKAQLLDASFRSKKLSFCVFSY